jgi:hypothetical protein
VEALLGPGARGTRVRRLYHVPIALLAQLWKVAHSGATNEALLPNVKTQLSSFPCPPSHIPPSPDQIYLFICMAWPSHTSHSHKKPPISLTPNRIWVVNNTIGLALDATQGPIGLRSQVHFNKRRHRCQVPSFPKTQSNTRTCCSRVSLSQAYDAPRNPWLTKWPTLAFHAPSPPTALPRSLTSWLKLLPLVRFGAQANFSQQYQRYFRSSPIRTPA